MSKKTGIISTTSNMGKVGGYRDSKSPSGKTRGSEPGAPKKADGGPGFPVVIRDDRAGGPKK